MARSDDRRDFIPVNIAVLTVSDTRTEADDTSGQALVEQQGSGLVFLPGYRGRENTFRSTPLDDLMPVAG